MLTDIKKMQIGKSGNLPSAKRRWFAAVIYLGLFFSVFSCATQDHGKLQSSPEITKIFDGSKVLSDHLYYFSGLQGVPDAIIGIHPNFSLISRGWQPVDLTSSMLNTLVYRMRQVGMLNPRGSWILDSDGNRVGVWFAAQRQTAVALRQNNRVVVVPPETPRLRGIR
jgi:hypothetical protein